MIIVRLTNPTQILGIKFLNPPKSFGTAVTELNLTNNARLKTYISRLHHNRKEPNPTTITSNETRCKPNRADLDLPKPQSETGNRTGRGFARRGESARRGRGFGSRDPPAREGRGSRGRRLWRAPPPFPPAAWPASARPPWGLVGVGLEGAAAVRVAVWCGFRFRFRFAGW